jgi:type II secretory pathway pseudopilin PulG
MTVQRRSRRGMTLVESVVVGCVALAGFALALPAIHAAQIFAKRAKTADNLKQVALAVANYEAANGAFPMSLVASPDPKQHGVGHSGFTAILPYIEQVPLFNAYNFDLEPFDAANNTVTRTRVDTFLVVENKNTASTKAADVLTLDGAPFPGKNEFGPLHFGLNWGGGHDGFGDDFVKAKGTFVGVMLPVVTAEGKTRGVRNVQLGEITDGTSFTLGVVEKRGSSGWAVGGFGGSEYDVHTSPAYTGDDARALKVLTGSVLETGPRAAFVDGSVRVMLPTMKQEIWYALQTRAGGEVIPEGALTP